jgi:hypothetical protein
LQHSGLPPAVDCGVAHCGVAVEKEQYQGYSALRCSS